ncbi:hypothetical protein CC2G_006349 [Coprinopsis cinerea AmutBmut pab1-1]|nr:hypothetical protein CC2G_006349 [Coprinopsis cinerea AmutBmut pab1-1]
MTSMTQPDFNSFPSPVQSELQVRFRRYQALEDERERSKEEQTRLSERIRLLEPKVLEARQFRFHLQHRPNRLSQDPAPYLPLRASCDTNGLDTLHAHRRNHLDAHLWALEKSSNRVSGFVDELL